MADFMQRPTDVLRSYMASRGFDDRETVSLLRLGRIAMALEILTVMKVLEEHELLAENEQVISVLQTLLVDQDLMDVSVTYYEELSRWRRIKLVPVSDESERDASIEDPSTDASTLEGQLDAWLLRGSNGAQLGSDQTTDPPSSE